MSGAIRTSLLGLDGTSVPIPGIQILELSGLSSGQGPQLPVPSWHRTANLENLRQLGAAAVQEGDAELSKGFDDLIVVAARDRAPALHQPVDRVGDLTKGGMVVIEVVRELIHFIWGKASRALCRSSFACRHDRSPFRSPNVVNRFN